jgi:hypothetical protein
MVAVSVSRPSVNVPDVLEVEEMQRLLEALGIRERAMVFLDMLSVSVVASWLASSGRTSTLRNFSST